MSPRPEGSEGTPAGGLESNPSLVPCRTCKHLVAKSAATCPQCGVAQPASNSVERGIDAFASGLGKLFRWLTVVVVVCVLVGIFTNPNEQSLKDHVRNRLKDELGIGAALVEPLVKIRYENFLLFSLGRIELPAEKEPRFAVGLLGSWRSINRPASRPVPNAEKLPVVKTARIVKTRP